MSASWLAANRSLRVWLLTAAAAGCGGARREEAAPATPARTELLPEDQSLTAPETEIEGIPFGPEALGLPAMPLGAARAPTTLDRQRKKVAQRPTAADVHLLAALLWAEAARLPPTDAARAAPLREEARTALRNARAQAGSKSDAATLHMLAVAEMSLRDDAAAANALQELLTRFPQHEGAAGLRVWLAYLHVRLHRAADASKATADWKPDQLGDTGAYVLAWAAFSAGDRERARRAITTAAATWRDETGRPAVERDLVFILARTGTDVAEAARLVAEAAGGDAQRRYAWMFRLSEAYKFAGDYQAAARVLDLVIEQGATAIPADDLVGFRYRQADYAFRLNHPAEAAARAIEAHRRLAACGVRCPEATAQAVTERLLKLAQFSHTVYARTQDAAHYDAAVALYQHYIAIPGRPDADAARGYLTGLQETKAGAEPGAGKHDLEVLMNFFHARREVVAACYESALLSQPGLEGSLRLSIEIDAAGTVGGAKSEPGAGAEGMALVAGCVIERARTWSFPSRTVPGKTVLAAPLEFRRQVAGQTAAAN
jgi:hypothetical protein